MIIFSSDASHNAFVGPICLPTQEEIFEGNSCILLGHEKSSSSNPMNIEGMKVTACSKFPKLASFLPDNSICTEKNQDMKFNNQGAGLICKIENSYSYQLAGIFLYGTDFTPSSFIDVAKYRNWIDSSMNEMKLDTSSYVFDPSSARWIYFPLLILICGLLCG